jgi:hypothetical protein
MKLNNNKKQDNSDHNNNKNKPPMEGHESIYIYERKTKKKLWLKNSRILK